MNISKNGLAIALLLSIGINLLILGAAGGMAVAGFRHKPPPHMITQPGPPQTRFQFNPKRFIRALPVSERRKAMRAMKGASATYRKIYQNINQTNRKLGVLLSADQLDDAKVEATFENLRTLEIKIPALGQHIILDILRDLDPQTRRRVIREASRRSAPSKHRMKNKPAERQRTGQ